MNVKNLSEKMLCLCTNTNEFDEMVVNENAYFNIATYNEYINGVLACDPVYYFEQILIENGFNVRKVNKTIVLSNEVVKEQKLLLKSNVDDNFEKFLNNDMNELNAVYVENAELLGINDESHDILMMYKDVIINDILIGKYFNFTKYCKTGEYINSRLAILKVTTFNCKLVLSTEYKIKLIHELEKINGITFYNFNDIDKYELPDELFDKIQISFKNRNNKPASKYEFVKFYIGLLKNLFGELGLFDAKQLRKSNGKEYVYSINNDNALKYLQLASYNDITYEHFRNDIIKHFNISKIIQKDNDICLFRKR
jgi:hypothetical protein